MSKLTTVNIDDIRPYAKNPRINDDAVDAVANSIRDFGYRNKIRVDRDMVIITGHTRYKALKKLGIKQIEVVVDDDMTPEQVRAYRIFDNSCSALSDWDLDLLPDELAALPDYDPTDYGLDLAEADDDPTEITEDEPPDPPETPVTKPGDVYRLGDHRLMCGDSTKLEDVEVLMDGNLADMVFTDPPWNVDYGSDPGQKYKERTILNDSMSTEDFKKFMGAAFESMKASIRGGGSCISSCRRRSGGT